MENSKNHVNSMNVQLEWLEDNVLQLKLLTGFSLCNQNPQLRY